MSKGAKMRYFRAHDDLWLPALAIAAERGEKLSDILRAALKAYIETWGTKS